MEEIVKDLEPKNRHLLEKRAILQEKIDAWYPDRKGKPLNLQDYKGFLMDVGYLIPEGDHFQITTANVDSDISKVAGPQLVVPLDNARYALNAANARWASLYDAYYGTDMILEGADDAIVVTGTGVGSAATCGVGSGVAIGGSGVGVGDAAT